MKTTLKVSFTLFIIAFSSLRSFASSYSPLQCRPSKAPLFLEEYKPIEMELTTDFDKINDLNLYPDDAKETLSSGTLKYYNNFDNTELNINVSVRARGGYRFEECSFRPLKIEISREEKARLKQIAPGNIFRKLGRKLKIVNLCSDMGIEEEQDKLMKEFYVYKLFQLFKTTSLKVRLVKLTMKNKDGTHLLTSYAFIREPKKRMAKRCGLKIEPQVYTTWNNETRRTSYIILGEDGQRIPYHPIKDPASFFKLELFNNFIRNSDYSVGSMQNNVVPMVGPGRDCPLFTPCERVYYASYDYDLGFVIDGGIYTTNYTDVESAPFFQEWLETYDTLPEIKRAQLKPFVKQSGAMKELIKNAVFLKEVPKKEMTDWLEAYLGVIKRYLNQ